MDEHMNANNYVWVDKNCKNFSKMLHKEVK